MKIINKILLICLFLTGATTACFAGIATNPLQDIYLARPMGMGQAFTAVGSSSAALFYNPAGVIGLKKLTVTAASKRLFFEETDYSIASLSWPTQHGVFSLGFVDTRLGESYATTRDPINNRIIVDASTEAMGYDNNALLLSYARQVNEKLSLGSNLKFYNQSIKGGGIGSRGTAYGLDIGGIYTINHAIKFGAVYQNILGSKLKWSGASSAEDTIGGYIKLGLSTNVLGKYRKALYYNRNHIVNVNFDVDLPHDTLSYDNNMLMHLGAEWSPIQDLYLRGGFNQAPGAGTHLTLGIGYERDGFRFDYAYFQRPGNLGEDNPHYFTITFVGQEPWDVKENNFVATKTPKNHDLVVPARIPVIGEVGISKKYYMSEITTITTTETRLISKEVENPKTKAKEIVMVEEIKTKKYQKPILKLISSEVYNIENLDHLSINGQGLTLDAVTGSFEGLVASLEYGRNVLTFRIYTTPEGEMIDKDTTYKVLRYKPFVDVLKDNNFLRPIVLGAELNIIKGYPGNKYYPWKGITRAEMAAVLVRLKGTKAIPYTPGYFKDVKTKDWYAKAIQTAVKEKIVSGYDNGTFKPQKVLSRAEAITMITRFAGIAPSAEAATQESAPYFDIAPGYWATPYIAAAKKAGILEYLNNTIQLTGAAESTEEVVARKTATKEYVAFYGNRNFLRAEAAEVLYQTKMVKERVNMFWEKGTIEVKTTSTTTTTSTSTTSTSTTTASSSTTTSTMLATPEATAPKISTTEAIKE